MLYALRLQSRTARFPLTQKEAYRRGSKKCVFFWNLGLFHKIIALTLPSAIEKCALKETRIKKDDCSYCAHGKKS